MRRRRVAGKVSDVGARRVAAWAWLAPLAVLALLLIGCGPVSTRAMPTQTAGLAANQTLRAALLVADRLPTLDPGAATATSVQEVDALLFDGLVTTDASLQVELWGASKISISSDGLTYTFTLRPGQSFSDGTPVTATDYAFSLDRALNPCTASPLAYNLFTIKNGQVFNNQVCTNGAISPQVGTSAPIITTLVGTSIVPDDLDRTLTITLASPAGYFLEALTAAPAYVLDPAVVGAATGGSGWATHLSDGATGRGGSGMYYLASPANGATHVTLKPNPHWWGLAAGKRPHLATIDLTLVTSATQSAAAYAGGRVDVALLPPSPPLQVGVTPTAMPSNEHTVPLLTSYDLLMNWTIPPLDNLDAREALCLAIDRGSVLRQVSAADQKIQGMATWHLVPAGMPGYDSDLTGPDGVKSGEGDPIAAKAHWQKYLQSLGGRSAPSFFYLDLQGSAWQAALGSALVAAWQSVLGISVTIQSQSPNILNGSDLTLGPVHPSSWSDAFADPQDVVSLQFGAGGTTNALGVTDPAATALLHGADRQTDQTVRLQEYQQAEQLLVREVAACPLWQATETYQTQPWVRGWSLTGLGMPANDAWLGTSITIH